MKRIVLTLIALAVLAFPISTIKIAIADDSYLTYAELKAYEEKKQEEQWSAQLVAYSQTLIRQGKKNQCVLALRDYFGVPRSKVQGAAKSTQINSKTGKVGAIVVFRNMSKWGHVAYQITPTRADGGYEIFHCNTDLKGTCKIETININDRRISGYRI